MEKNEVIYISSDDDEEISQNKSKSEQVSIIKLGNDYISSVKVGVLTNKNEKVETFGQKRKVSEISSDNDIGSKKSAKVFVHEKEDNSETFNIEEVSNELINSQTNKETVVLKPKLIIKERKIFSPTEQDIFPMFISLCLQKDRSEDMKVIVNKLKRRYEQLDMTYANSETFINFLNEKRNSIMNSKNQLYTHIAEVMNEMKNRYSRKSTSLLNIKGCSSNTNRMNNNNSNNSSTICTSAIHTNDIAVEVKRLNENNKEDQKESDTLQAKIRKILKTMKRCEKYIKKLEESEVNFVEEHNSSYIKLEKFKYRMVELYNKYCEYTGENADAGRQYLRPKHFSTTGIVAVDHAITSFINSKISKRNKLKKIGASANAIIFPDYRDILECVAKCNELHNLGLDNKKQQQIAKKAFTELGEFLQRSRRNDYWDTFSLFLENEDDDPALKDTELAEKLMQNKREGEKRLANVFQEYVKKQEETKEIINPETSSEDEEDEEENTENMDKDFTNTDEFCEDDTHLSIEEDKNNVVEGECSKNKTNTDDRPSIKTNTEVVEVDEKHEMNENSRLKNNDDKNLNLISINDIANIPNCKNNSKLQSEEIKDVTLPNTSINATSSTQVAEEIKVDKSPIDKVKEDESYNVSEESTDGKPLEEEKPLLRVRSFAKPPTTWEDIQEKVEKSNTDKAASEKLVNANVIDLTKETSNETSTLTQCTTIQIGSKVLPLTKGKYKTWVIPAGKSIINVKNITNNYVRLNTRDGNKSNTIKSPNNQVIATVHSAVGINKGSMIVRLPASLSTTHQTNTNNQTKDIPIKQNTNKVVQICQSSRTIWLTKEQKESLLQASKSK